MEKTLLNKKTITRTNYFSKPGTWFKRTFYATILVSQLFIWNLEDDIFYLKPLLITVVILAVFGSRKDDLAVDSKYLYHLQTSLIPFLTRIDKYEISQIESIRGKGFDSSFWELFGNRSLIRIGNTIELNFTDNSSKSIEASIYKKELERIIDAVQLIIKTKSA